MASLIYFQKSRLCRDFFYGFLCCYSWEDKDDGCFNYYLIFRGGVIRHTIFVQLLISSQKPTVVQVLQVEFYRPDFPEFTLDLFWKHCGSVIQIWINERLGFIFFKAFFSLHQLNIKWSVEYSIIFHFTNSAKNWETAGNKTP